MTQLHMSHGTKYTQLGTQVTVASCILIYELDIKFSGQQTETHDVSWHLSMICPFFLINVIEMRWSRGIQGLSMGLLAYVMNVSHRDASSVEIPSHLSRNGV